MKSENFNGFTFINLFLVLIIKIQDMVMQSTTFTFKDHDNMDIFVYKFMPDTKAKAIIQISHGMAEHAARYARFAEALTNAGYGVYANDHRGHGKTAGTEANRGKLGAGGWKSTVEDIKELTDLIKKQNPILPVFLFAHSWGSFMGQNYIQNWGDGIKGVILSGSNGKQGMIGIGMKLTGMQIKSKGADAPGVVMDKMSFGSFNNKFKPAKTNFDWLSRDEAEVQKYVNDPWCGFVCANSFFLELLGGLKHIWTPANEGKIPKSLPIYIMAGSNDPVSQQTKGLQELIKRYTKLGIADLSSKFYPGGRHEMLNETNRDEVMKDIIAWFDKHL